MFSKLIRLFKTSIIAQILLLAVFGIAFFHEVFRMEFWKDDYAILCNIQHACHSNLQIPENLKYFVWPYQHFASMHAPLYSAFKLNPFGYFAVGFLALFISAVIFYFLVYELFSKKSLAFIASLIYLSSPIGVDNTFMMVTFLTGYLLPALFLTTLLFLYKYYKKRKLGYYLISLSTLFVAFEFLPNRSFYLPLIILIFEFIYFQKKKDSVRKFLLRQLVLVIAFIYFFYISPHMIYQSERIPNNLFDDIVNYKLFLNPVLTSVNMIYGGLAYFFSGNFSFFYSRIGWISGISILIITIICFVYFVLRSKKSEQHIIKIFFFALIYLYLTALAFYDFSQREISTASFRYLLPALPAYSLLIISIYIFATKINYGKNYIFRSIPLLLITIIISINIITTQFYIVDFNSRAPYTRQFIEQLNKYIPKLPKNAVIYFKLDEDAAINHRLIDSYRIGVYGPEAFFAVRYNLPVEDVNPPYNTYVDYSEFLSIIEKKQITRNKIFAFKYSMIGLTDITKEFRQSIQVPGNK